MRILIIDDEPLARMALTEILAARRDVENFESANDAIEAFEKLGKYSYDVLLLDIKMPEVSGMELLDRLENKSRMMPAVIFVTAHDDHAIAAFEKHAIDYVLKPFTAERSVKLLIWRFAELRRSERGSWSMRCRSCKGLYSGNRRGLRSRPKEEFSSLTPWT